MWSMKRRILSIYAGAAVSIAVILTMLGLRGLWLVAAVGLTMLFWILLSYRVTCPRCAHPVLLRKSGLGYKWVAGVPEKCSSCGLELE
jgi:hypothetical protein